ncbi:MAG: 50S ribosomal protein L25 [Deltaproteobacteria bacterium]|nr:50S ribosomal protein L25 [Deltaproteobacteria bacterium]
METIEIQIEPREAGAKGRAKQLRREGKLPGIFYGPKAESVPLELDRKDFLSRVAGLEGSHLIRIKSSSPLLAERVALVKEMQFHPVTGEVVHADLYEVDLSARIRVKVPLHFVGKAEGVVRGGILQPVVREIEVECLPMDIPEYFDVEVSSLDIGDSLHVKDLSIPEGVTAVYESNLTLVTVVPPTVEEAPAAAEVAPVAVEGAEAAAPAPEEKKEEEGSKA